MEKKDTQKAIAPGMTSEEIRAVYFNADALREPSYKVYQLNTDGYRYYYRFGEDGQPEFFPSVTTMLRQVTPTSPGLIDWMLAKGSREAANEERDIAAAYGTFMHGEFEKLIVARRYDFDAVPSALLTYMERESVPESLFPQWLVKVRKDVLAFAQWMKSYNVKPLAVEIGLVHPEHRYAGCVDLVCELTSGGKTYTAIVDFKSGRKGFYEEHELQLHLYKAMWEANFPDVPIDKVYNFSPKDWRTGPTFNFKDQTDSVNAEKLPHLLALAKIEDEKRESTVTLVHGTLDMDAENFEGNILTLSLAELVCRRAAESDETPDEAADTALFDLQEG